MNCSNERLITRKINSAITEVNRKYFDVIRTNKNYITFHIDITTKFIYNEQMVDDFETLLKKFLIKTTNTSNSYAQLYTFNRIVKIDNELSYVEIKIIEGLKKFDVPIIVQYNEPELNLNHKHEPKTLYETLIEYKREEFIPN
jgi:hypothetical protein